MNALTAFHSTIFYLIAQKTKCKTAARTLSPETENTNTALHIQQ